MRAIDISTETRRRKRKRRKTIRKKNGGRGTTEPGQEPSSAQRVPGGQAMPNDVKGKKLQLTIKYAPAKLIGVD